MFATKIACPQCRAVLRPPHPLPVGQKVKCSGCGTYFLVEAEAPPAFGTGPPDFRVAVAPPPPLPGPPLYPPPPRTPAAEPGTNWTLLSLIVGGALVLLGGGAFILVQALSGEKEPGKPGPVAIHKTTEEEPDPDDHPPPVKRPEDKKTSTEKKPEERGDSLSREQQAQVNQAIDRGMVYLKSAQNADGSWSSPENQLSFFTAGMTSLAGLTLLECGVAKEDPTIQKTAAYLRNRQSGDPNQKIYLTYDLSLAILFLDCLGEPKDRELIRSLALRLLTGQKANGGWSYLCEKLTDSESQALYTLLKDNQDSVSPLNLKHVEVSKLHLDGLANVPDLLKNLAVWQDDIKEEPQGQTYWADNSNTQFAILALWAAKAYDLPLQRTLALLVKHFRTTQQADGSWYYRKNLHVAPNSYFPTMTCAGLLGLAVGLGLANEAQAKGGAAAPPRKPAEKDPQIQKGLAVLAKFVDNPHKPWGEAAAAPQIDLYFLWSVERVGVIFKLSRLDGKDWYGWGAEKLIANQNKAQGNWEKGVYSHAHPVVDTCFALLFLKRANLARDLTAKLQLD